MKTFTSMSSENYRQVLNNEFKSKEMSSDDFDNTLMQFAMLYHKEQKRKIERDDIIKEMTALEYKQPAMFREAFKQGDIHYRLLKNELENLK